MRCNSSHAPLAFNLYKTENYLNSVFKIFPSVMYKDYCYKDTEETLF